MKGIRLGIREEERIEYKKLSNKMMENEKAKYVKSIYRIMISKKQKHMGFL